MKKIVMLSLMGIWLNANGVTGLSVNQENISKNSQITNSSVKQGEVNIKDSTLSNVTVGSVENKNMSKIEDSHISNSEVSQNIVDINGSSVSETDFYSDSKIVDADIKNSSIVLQGALLVSNSGEVKNSSFTLNSSIDNAVINNSTLSQNEIVVDHATVDNLTINGTHTIHNSTVNITNSTVIQGKLSVIENSMFQNSTIDMTSSIDGADITDSTVDLCSLYISNGANVSGANIDGTCIMNNVKIRNATVVSGAVVVH